MLLRVISMASSCRSRLGLGEQGAPERDEIRKQWLSHAPARSEYKTPCLERERNGVADVTRLARTRAVVIEDFDDPPHLAEIPVPEIEPTQVLVRVRAASINAFDWKAAGGVFRTMFQYRFPVTIGRDYSGVVVAIGERVSRVNVGDEVFGYFTGTELHRGSYADRVWVDERECFVVKLRELILLTAARHFDAQYSWNAHVDKAADAGVDRGALEQLAVRAVPAFTSRDEQVVHAFCTELLEDHFVSDATFAEAHELLGSAGVVDIVGALGNFSMLAMCLNAFEVDLQPDREPPFADVGAGRKV